MSSLIDSTENREMNYRKKHSSTASLIVEVSITTQERDKRKAQIYSAAGVGKIDIRKDGPNLKIVT